MRTLSTRSVFVPTLLLLGLLTAGLAQPLLAQSNADKEVVRLDRRIANLIRSLDEIVWSNVTIYKLESEFQSRLRRAMQAEDQQDIDFIEGIGQTVYFVEPLPNFADRVMTRASNPLTGRDLQRFKQAIAQDYGIDPIDLDDTEMQEALNRAKSVLAKREARPDEFYLVTSREQNPVRIIALVGAKEQDGKISIKDVKAGTQVYSYLNGSNGNGVDTAMYAELKTAASAPGGAQGLTNVMFNLRNLADITLADRTKARATYIKEDKHHFILKSISSGRPVRGEYSEESDSAGGGFNFDNFDAGLFGGDKKKGVVEGAAVPNTAEYPYEIVLGSDVVAAFHSYDLVDKQLPEPQWGLELINNFDEVNYPSIWGGRMTLNAILENVKIGAILPTLRLGGNTIDSSGIGEAHQKIIGGYGLAFSGDFAAPILSNSGLFNFHASYTFSEVSTDKIRANRLELDEAGDTLSFAGGGEDSYLIRFALQTYYSFGFYADADAQHLFRLKLGGTVYGVDKFEASNVVTNFVGGEQDSTLDFSQVKSQTIGGVSGKVEYMKGGTKIPYGIGVQYFDQSVLANIWLQFPVLRNLDLKLEGKYFSPLFRDPYAWENDGLVVPSVALKYHFGTVDTGSGGLFGAP